LLPFAPAENERVVELSTTLKVGTDGEPRDAVL